MHKIEDIKLPNLFIVGAPRCGTTSIYEYLKQHPDVFMSPIKEPHYFARKDISEFHDGIAPPDVILDFKDYIGLFGGGRNKKIRGEASTNYLYSKSATFEIFKLVPDAKIIISLRDPIERALSHFKRDIFAYGIIVSRSFCEAIKIRPFYLRMGLYYEHVKRYIETFSSKNVKIVIFDDLKRDTLLVMKDICRFLEIDENYVFNIDLSKKYNASWIPRSLIINKFVVKVRDYILKRILPRSFYRELKHLYFKIFAAKDSNHFDFVINNCIDFLVNYFREDVRKLSELLGRDLSFWFEKWGYKV